MQNHLTAGSRSCFRLFHLDIRIDLFSNNELRANSVIHF